MEMWAFPLSGIFFAIFCTASYLSYGLYKRSGFLHGRKLTVAVMAIVAALMAVEGIWKLNLQHSVVFLVTVLFATWLVAESTIDAIRSKARLSFVFAHLGFCLILSGGFFGAPDFTAASLVVTPGKAESYARSEDGLTVPLDFAVDLKEFRIDWYDDGKSPRQYTSVLEIDGREMTTSVNHPCLFKGWMIYQSDYDKTDRAYTVLRLVKDPWLPVVLLGMALLALGAVLGLRGTWKSKAVIPVALGLTVVFGGISVARISFGTLMPALRSFWFVPHLIIYMLAYSLLAIALVCALIPRERTLELARKLLPTSSALLIIGMLCGAVWAKAAWGDYWTWDAKECWAAVTWMITLCGIHLADLKKRGNIVIVIILAFLAMQVTWYGVNWLPSAKYSMHTYNSK